MSVGYKMRVDVFVLGGGLSGAAAAFEAARNGVTVALAERSFMLGGAATLSLVNPWQTFHSHSGRVIGGFAQELTDRLLASGHSLGHLPDPVGFATSVTPIDPDGLRAALDEMARERGVAVLYGHRLRDAEIVENRLRSVTLEDEHSGTICVRASAFIDASGNGDLSSIAGCRMEIDSDCQPMTLIFTMDNVDFEAVAAYHRAHPDEFYEGAAIDGPLRGGYIGVSGFFEHVRRAKESGRLAVPRDRVLFFGNTRPGQVVVNTTRVTGKNGASGTELSEAMGEGLAQTKNLVAFMTSDLPGFERARVVRIADQIGVRETRRLIGRYVMDENDIHANASFDDTIAKGAFPLDIHSGADASLSYEKVSGKGHYDIPLRCLLNSEVGNLLTVGKCISVTHKGFSSTRVMPTCMAVGQAGGAAAALSAKLKRDPEEIYPLVRDTLRSAGAIISEEDIVNDIDALMRG